MATTNECLLKEHLEAIHLLVSLFHLLPWNYASHSRLCEDWEWLLSWWESCPHRANSRQDFSWGFWEKGRLFKKFFLRKYEKQLLPSCNHKGKRLSMKLRRLWISETKRDERVSNEPFTELHENISVMWTKKLSCYLSQLVWSFLSL